MKGRKTRITRKSLGEPPRFTKEKDKHGTIWTANPSPVSKTKPVEIWADHKPEDSVSLRQENKGGVDLIVLDLGQAYDVIRALTEAIENA